MATRLSLSCLFQKPACLQITARSVCFDASYDRRWPTSDRGCASSPLAARFQHVPTVTPALLQRRHCYSGKFQHAIHGPPLTEERAAELVYNLKDSERLSIKQALDKYEAMKMKETFEGKLAATQWRTKFGRLSQVPGLGDVDPTGSFCTFPADWLKTRAAANAKELSSKDLWTIFFVNAVPFVAFGFLDNFIMIVAGDYIEHWFGALMGLSTMAAAGLGNTISDLMGIGSAHYVERGCEMIGLRPPDMTPVQVEMKKVRRSANWGRMVGITVGCLLGMFPLLFLDEKDKEKDKDKDKEQEIQTAIN